MVMRYHWGLAAGHTYAHVKGTNSEPEMPACANVITSDEGPETSSGTVNMGEENQNDDDPELGFENRQDDLIDDRANSDGEGSAHHGYSVIPAGFVWSFSTGTCTGIRIWTHGKTR